MNNKPIYVTQPSLPPLEEYTSLLNEIWDSGILTHNGPFVRQFENMLAAELQLKNFAAVSNGTVALQIAIKALKLQGEIITTPFSWIATVSAIKWEGCKPVFCDIDEQTFNIDVSKIEALINKETVAIMPVHVFGNPCDVYEIEKIAKKHGLRVIYDAAHAIGSSINGNSLLSFGDISATSLHSTKLLNTGEGGGCVSANQAIYEKIKRIRFFGHNENKDIVENGFNGKMTEIAAALGVANMKYFQEVLSDRKNKYFFYKDKLSDCDNLTFQELKHGEPNYSYFPIVFENEEILLKVVRALETKYIYPRRYFHPSLNTCNNVVEYARMPNSEKLADRILCLPLYKKLRYEEMGIIIDILMENIN